MAKINLPSRISYTQLATWQRCHMQYFLKYIVGFSRVAGSSAGLRRGALLHNAYDTYMFKDRASHDLAYDQVDLDAEDMLNRGEDVLEVNKSILEAKTVLEFYLPYADKHDNFEIVLAAEDQDQVEYSGVGKLPMPDGRTKDVTFKIDAVIKMNGTDALYMMEHKFRKDSRMQPLEHDQQSILYQALWNQLHPERPLIGLLYNVVEVRESYEPQMRKDGKGWLKYASPEHIESECVKRQKLHRGENEMRNALIQAGNAAYEIQRNAESEFPVWPMNPNSECKWCEFVGPCLAVRAGGSIDEYVATGQYSTRDSRSRNDSNGQTVASKTSDSALNGAQFSISDLIDI